MHSNSKFLKFILTHRIMKKNYNKQGKVFDSNIAKTSIANEKDSDSFIHSRVFKF